jgi:hypothetical protein
MPKGLRTPFQRGHDVEFELELTERDKGSGAVKSVICRFCLKFGREPKPGQTRKRTSNILIFKLPFICSRRSPRYSRTK